MLMKFIVEQKEFMNKTYIFDFEMEVRDYECDLQGIVNNAVYMNYLEHCRHKFLKSIGLDFSKLHQEGLDLVLIKAQLNYIKSLKSGDKFLIKISIKPKGRFKILFFQDIYCNDELVLASEMTGTCVKNGKVSLEKTIVDIIGSKIELK